MPNAVIEKWAKKTNLSVDDLEEKWKMAEEIASEKFDEDDDSFYPYLMGIFKNSMSNKEMAKIESIEVISDILLSGYKTLFESNNLITNIVWTCPHCNKDIGQKDLAYDTVDEAWYHIDCVDKGQIYLENLEK